MERKWPIIGGEMQGPGLDRTTLMAVMGTNGYDGCSVRRRVRSGARWLESLKSLDLVRGPILKP